MIPASCQWVSRLFQKVCHLLAWLRSTAENTHIACEPCAKCNCSPFQYKRTRALKTVSAAVLQLTLKRILKFTSLCKTLDASRPTQQGEYNIHVPYSIKKAQVRSFMLLTCRDVYTIWRSWYILRAVYNDEAYMIGPLCTNTAAMLTLWAANLFAPVQDPPNFLLRQA